MCAGLDLGVRTVAESMRNLGLAGLNTHQRQSKRGGLSPRRNARFAREKPGQARPRSKYRLKCGFICAPYSLTPKTVRS